MPLVKTIQIAPATQAGIWHITEPEEFFRQEVQVFRPIRHPHKRLQHFAARYLLKVLFPGFPVNQIQAAAGAKPYINGHLFHFSITHSRDYAAAIVSEQYRVGIDIEYMQPLISAVASKFLSETEQQFIDPRQSLLHQTICWTAKEAAYKWYGRGEVDFKKHILLRPFAVQQAGEAACEFRKDDTAALLRLHYEAGKEYCVAWVYS
jgi:phosphopantetheinyl transferase